MSTGEKVKIDIAIVGGGIVGLWICYELLKQKKAKDIVIFERENFLLEHTSGRNSEVLHAGLYYPANSLKHTLCIEGNDLWRNFIKKNQMEFLDCGKFIISPENDTTNIEELFLKAKDNGVKGLRWASKSEIKLLKEYVRVEYAFYSPSSAVINVGQAGKILKDKIEKLGGVILTNSLVKIKEKNHSHFLLELKDHTIVESQFLINTGGLSAIDLRTSLGLDNYRNFYVKGNYLKLNRKIDAKSLIYPVPPKDKLGLGIHLTLDTNMDQKFGPNTEITEKIDYKVSSSLIDQMFPSIKDHFPTVLKENLSLAYAGIRPKIKTIDNVTVDDFIIDNPIRNYIELLGIESPGLTASPAIAKVVSKLIV